MSHLSFCSRCQLTSYMLGTALLFTGMTNTQAGLPTIEPALEDNQTTAMRVVAQSTAGAVKVATRVNALKVTIDPNTKQEQLIPVTAQTPIQSGDIIEYQGLYINAAPERIRSMRAGLSIPDNMILIEDSIEPKLAYGSIDNRQFVHMPLRRQVNGQVVPLDAKYYRGLQWELQGFDLNESKLVKYRAQVK